MSVRSIRIIRSDKRLKIKDTGSLVEAGGSCPTITLGDLSQDIFFVGDSINATIDISGGVDPFSIMLTGSLPTNSTWAVVGTQIQITPSHGMAVFGSSTFSFSGTDSNGCPVTPKEYTIEVWQENEKTTPVSLVLGSGQMTLPVSGLPNSLGTGVKLEKVTINATVDVLDAIGIGIARSGPSTDFIAFNSQYTISGANVTDAVFSGESNTDMDTGSAPYTGTWQDGVEGVRFIDLNGANPNTTWYLIFNDDSASAVGSIDSFKLTFKPI